MRPTLLLWVCMSYKARLDHAITWEMITLPTLSVPYLPHMKGYIVSPPSWCILASD